jgi:uncharacterized protein YjiS (DUF1127 family)
MSIQHISAVAQPRRPSFLSRTFRFVALVASARRDRRTLAQLDPHLLRDIGLTREQAEAEAARALWDVPSHWRG